MNNNPHPKGSKPASEDNQALKLVTIFLILLFYSSLNNASFIDNYSAKLIIFSNP